MRVPDFDTRVLPVVWIALAAVWVVTFVKVALARPRPPRRWTEAACRAAHQGLATLVRPVSVTAFAAKIVALLKPSFFYPFGRRWWDDVWYQLDFMATILAAAALLGCLLVAAFRVWCGPDGLKRTRWCWWLNAATVAWSMVLSPATQRVREAAAGFSHVFPD